MRLRTPLTKALDSSVPNDLASSTASSRMTARGTSGRWTQLPRPEAQDVAVDARHALEPPVGRGLADASRRSRRASPSTPRTASSAYARPSGSASKLRQKSAITSLGAARREASIWKSIWSAASRPECRAPTSEPRARRAREPSDTISMARDGRVPALVAGLRAGALDRLLDGVGGQDAERDRHAGRERGGRRPPWRPRPTT